MKCLWCKEPVLEGEQHPDFQQPTHLECGFRSTVGSYAHIAQRCSCFVAGSTESDPPGMTKRQAAMQAWVLFRMLHSRAGAA